MKNEKLYNKWYRIKNKCYNPNDANFEYYGEKGIVICEEWEDYNSFKEWAIHNGYKPNLVLSRKDNNGDYEPSNCEWITDAEHRSKRSRTKKIEYIEYQNKYITIAELSRLVGISFNTLRNRYFAGKRGEELINMKGLKVAI